MEPLHVPAREIPVPDSISPEAQAVLGMGFFGVDSTSPGDSKYPATDDLEAWRTHVAESDAAALPFLEGMAEATDVTAERREIGGVPVDVVMPAGNEDDDRLVIDIHGGALIYMGGAVCTAMAKLAVSRTGMPTWAPDYRMAPDHPHPAPLDDCLAVYRAALDVRAADRIVVAGGSAGGNLAAALAVRAKEEGLPAPAALVLHTPEVDLTESGDSFRTNLGVDTILGLLLPVNELHAAGHDLDHPHLSPLFADLTGFPPTVLTTGTRDLFLSNTVRMHRALRRVGVEAELHVLEAAPHANFFGMAPEDHELDAEVRRFIDRHCPPM